MEKVKALESAKLVNSSAKIYLVSTTYQVLFWVLEVLPS